MSEDVLDGHKEDEEGGGEEDLELDPLMDEILLDVDGLVGSDNPQTLEDILNEVDLVGDTDGWRDDVSVTSTPRKQYAIPAGGLDSDIGETLSVSSFGSRGTRTSQRSKQASDRVYGSVFRHVILKGISAQMTSAADRVGAGLPTCMAATHLIAVGTQAANILVFDSNQVIKWFLGGKDIGQNYGAVSALAFSVDSTRLLVGFARGQVMEFDMVSGKLVRDLPDVHPPGSAVVHLRYSDDINVAFLSDSGGSVFEINMKRGIRGAGATCRCIFSGSRGEVCTMEPLRVPRTLEHPLSAFSILALATISKIIVVTVRPRLKVLITTALVGDSSTLPLVCWQFVVIQNQFSNKSNDPVLTFARGDTIHFYQVSVNLSNKILFIPLQTISLSFNVLSVSWLNSRCLGLLDQNEHYHLLDVRTKESLETVDLSQVEVVYQTQFFKGLANGGNVSGAFSLAGEMAVYGSSAVFTNQLLILGNKTFHALIIRTWTERLDHLVKDNKYLEAIALGLDMYEDPGKSLVGLRGSKERKRAHISLRLMGLLKRFLDVSFTTSFPEEGGMGTLTKYFNEIVPPCVSICLRLNKTEFLFDKVWNSFAVDPFSCAAFLENLEPYILSDQLTVIPTSIVQQFVEHYEKREKLVELEACITHLHIMCLDIHQIMSVCERHSLFDAIIYVHNSALLDYISPAEKILAELSRAQAADTPLTQKQVELGNKLLVYISGCLAGRAYPFGDIPKERVKQVKYDIYSTITLLHSRRIDAATDTEPPYPHLHTFLLFDTQAFLNVLSIAFEEEEYQTEIGKSQKQRLVDILLQVMVKDNSPFSPSQIGFLFTFLARQLARGDNCLSISRDLFSRVLGVLTDPEELGHKEERQDALIDMINCGGWELFDPVLLEQSCIAVGFYRVLRLIYSDREEYSKILDCIIKDVVRQNQVFTFLQSIYTDDVYTAADRDSVASQLLANILNLINIDVKKTVVILAQFRVELIPKVVDRVRGEDKFFEFLTHLLELHESSEPRSPSRTMEHVCSVELYEEYIELMCEQAPTGLLHYIKTKHKYRPEVVMKLCERFNILDGKIYLLETQGRLEEAFSVLKGQMDDRINEFLANEGGEPELKVVGINTSLLIVIQFCQRVSGRLTEDKRESMWCSLLNDVAKPIQVVVNPDPWREMIRHIVSSMLGHVGHKKVVTLILSNPSCSGGKWSDLKQMLLELIETFRYEQRLVESGIHVLEKERANKLRLLVRARTKAVYSATSSCCVCGSALRGKLRNVVFSCHHAFHVECADRCGGVALSSTGEEIWSCVVCQPNVNQKNLDRVVLTDSGSTTGVEDETLNKSIESWKKVNEPVLYSSSSNYEDIEGFINSDSFKLRLRPTRNQ